MSSFPVLASLAFRWRPDVAIVVEPSFFSLPGALIAAKLSGSVSWLHVQDFEIDAAFELKILKNEFLKTVAQAFDRWITRRFDGCSTISVNMVNSLINKGVAPERTLLLPNWVDTDFISPNVNDRNEFRRELKLNDEIVVLYSGNLGEKQGLHILKDVSRFLDENEKIILIICGEGAGKEALEMLLSDARNVKFIPLQPLEKLNGLLNAADIHILPQREDIADLVMPSKLTGILSSGRPVVAGARAGTAVAEVVEEVGGIVCKPENGLEMAQGILRLASDPALRETIGLKSRAFALENLGRDALLRRLEDAVARAVRPEKLD